MRAHLAIWGVAMALAAVAPARAATRPVTVVQGARADAVTLADAAQTLEPSNCREALLADLEGGRATSHGCEAERKRLARRLIRRQGRAFGFVHRRDVELARVRLVLGRAVRCKAWPTWTADRDVLDPRDVDAAACRQRRYQGPVAVTVIDKRGRRLTLPPVHTDEDGKLEIVFARIDEMLRTAGHGPLRRWQQIELGHDGWAGTVDLQRLRSFRADWHSRWVRAGRGVPALFTVAHPEHPASVEIRALAVEARLARQARDFARVEAGSMSPREFLLRHAWSPYRRAVELLASGGASSDPPASSR